ncbi:MAG: phospholipase D-like domain-containing protein [Conexivisphaerales archaeon]
MFDFKDHEKKQLHAKIIVSDRTKALVGSANFSWGGMYSNYEIGLLIEGQVACKLGDITDYLSNRIIKKPAVN